MNNTDNNPKNSFLSGFISLILLVGLLASCEPINPSHEQPWSPEGIDTKVSAGDLELLSRTILIGDAGSSIIDPLEASLDFASEIAGQAPEKTSVIMLGDNIYLQGYPSLEAGQSEFDEDQREDISHLDAQLEIAKRSKAEMFFVPGNHDWYAEELDGQARHIDRAAKEHNIKAKFVPHNEGHAPAPQVQHRAGISYVFIDSQWLIVNSASEVTAAMTALQQVINKTVARYRPSPNRNHGATCPILYWSHLSALH